LEKAAASEEKLEGNFCFMFAHKCAPQTMIKASQSSRTTPTMKNILQTLFIAENMIPAKSSGGREAFQKLLARSCWVFNNLATKTERDSQAKASEKLIISDNAKPAPTAVTL